MAFIGVRISWLMFARKSLLARLATSAVSLAFWSCAVSAQIQAHLHGVPAPVLSAKDSNELCNIAIEVDKEFGPKINSHQD